jgi:hypothetical protein
VTGGSELGGKVTVIMKGVGVTELDEDKLNPQLDTSRAAARIRKMNFGTWQL